MECRRIQLREWQSDLVPAGSQCFPNIRNHAGNNFHFASSPAGAAGQLGPYNSFLGCLLLYDPSADCLLTQTNTLAVTNKTFNVSLNNFQCPTNTAGLYLRDNGTQLVCAPLNLSDETTVFTLSST